MPHICSSVLVRCMDFRLTREINHWLESKGLINDCDIISIAGITKAIADDFSSPEAQFVLKQINLSRQLHQTKVVYLMHHTDCGAYGGHTAFHNLEEEKQCYTTDMEKAKAIIEKEIPGVDVKFILADIMNNGAVEFHEI